jgi:hypothetical protein
MSFLEICVPRVVRVLSKALIGAFFVVAFFSFTDQAKAAIDCTQLALQAAANPGSAPAAGSCTSGGQTFNFACTATSCTASNQSGQSCTVSFNGSGVTSISGSGCFGSNAAQTANATVRQASQVSMQAVQNQIASIRDSIQRRRYSPASGRPLGFAADPDESGSAQTAALSDSPWQALGYAKGGGAVSPVFKAPPAAAIPATPAMQFAGWGQMFGDFEQRTGVFNGLDIGRKTWTTGGIGGVDATFNRAFGSDAFVLGLLAGEMVARVTNNDGSTARVAGPSLGIYGIYVLGGFSTDTSFKVDFLKLDTSTVGFTGLGSKNYAVASNVNYKFDFPGYWVEPTAGVSFTRAVWDSTAQALGMTDGRTTRLQGGVRTGTTWMWSNIRVEPVLTGLLYDDVSISGGTIATAITPTAPSDQGKLFGQVIGKLGFDWGRGLSSYVEGEVRGRNQVFGTAARVGLRYMFQ